MLSRTRSLKLLAILVEKKNPSRLLFFLSLSCSLNKIFSCLDGCTTTL